MKNARYFRSNDDNIISVVHTELSQFFSLYGIEGFDTETEEWEEDIVTGDCVYVEKDSNDEYNLVFLHGNGTIEYQRGINTEDYSKFRFDFERETEYDTIEELYESLASSAATAFEGVIEWTGSNYELFAFVGGTLGDADYEEVEFEQLEELAETRADWATKSLYAAWEDGARQLYVGTHADSADEPFMYLEAIEQDDIETLAQFEEYDFENEGEFVIMSSALGVTAPEHKVVETFSNEGAAQLEADILSCRDDRTRYEVVENEVVSE
jgi:hypothetical protein